MFISVSLVKDVIVFSIFHKPMGSITDCSDKHCIEEKQKRLRKVFYGKNNRSLTGRIKKKVTNRWFSVLATMAKGRENDKI